MYNILVDDKIPDGKIIRKLGDDKLIVSETTAYKVIFSDGAAKENIELAGELAMSLIKTKINKLIIKYYGT